MRGLRRPALARQAAPGHALAPAVPRAARAVHRLVALGVLRGGEGARRCLGVAARRLFFLVAFFSAPLADGGVSIARVVRTPRRRRARVTAAAGPGPPRKRRERGRTRRGTRSRRTRRARRTRRWRTRPPTRGGLAGNQTPPWAAALADARGHQGRGLVARHARDGWRNAHARVRGYPCEGTARAGVSQEFLEAKRVTPSVFIAKYRYNLNSRTLVWSPWFSLSIRRPRFFDWSKQVSGCDHSRCRFFFLSPKALLPRSVKSETSPHHQSGDARGAGGGHAAPVPEHGPPLGRGHKEGRRWHGASPRTVLRTAIGTLTFLLVVHHERRRERGTTESFAPFATLSHTRPSPHARCRRSRTREPQRQAPGRGDHRPRCGCSTTPARSATSSTKPARATAEGFVVRGMAFSPCSTSWPSGRATTSSSCISWAGVGTKASAANHAAPSGDGAGLARRAGGGSPLPRRKVRVGVLNTNKATTLYAHPEQSYVVSLCAARTGTGVQPNSTGRFSCFRSSPESPPGSRRTRARRAASLGEGAGAGGRAFDQP